MAMTNLRESITPPIARAARKPKNGKGLNKNDNKTKIEHKRRKYQISRIQSTLVKIETLIPSLFIFDSE